MVQHGHSFGYEEGSLLCLARWPTCLLVDLAPLDPRVDELDQLLRAADPKTAVVAFLSAEDMSQVPSFGLVRVTADGVRVVVHGAIDAQVDDATLFGTPHPNGWTTTLVDKVALFTGQREAQTAAGGLWLSEGMVRAGAISVDAGKQTVEVVRAPARIPDQQPLDTAVAVDAVIQPTPEPAVAVVPESGGVPTGGSQNDLQRTEHEQSDLPATNGQVPVTVEDAGALDGFEHLFSTGPVKEPQSDGSPSGEGNAGGTGDVSVTSGDVIADESDSGDDDPGRTMSAPATTALAELLAGDDRAAHDVFSGVSASGTGFSVPEAGSLAGMPGLGGTADSAGATAPVSGQTPGFIGSFDWMSLAPTAAAAAAPVFVPPSAAQPAQPGAGPVLVQPPDPRLGTPAQTPVAAAQPQAALTPPSPIPLVTPDPSVPPIAAGMPADLAFDATIRRSQLTQMTGSGDVLVVAFTCPQGHFSPPYVPNCRVCGAALNQSQQPAQVPRPPLGVLHLWAGGEIVLDRGVVMGRNPHVIPGATGPEPSLLRIQDPNRDISSQHCEVRLDDWFVSVCDLNSTNGTQVILPHRPPVTLRPDDPMTIDPGTRVILANAFDFIYEVT